jgi:hypothetical protein
VSSLYYSNAAVTRGPDLDSVAFNSTEEENDTALKTIRRRAWTTLLDKIKEHTADAALLAKLRASFEELFRYDEHGVLEARGRFRRRLQEVQGCREYRYPTGSAKRSPSRRHSTFSLSIRISPLQTLLSS